MMSFLANSFPVWAAYNARPTDCLSRPLAPMAQAVALFRLASSRKISAPSYISLRLDVFKERMIVPFSVGTPIL